MYHNVYRVHTDIIFQMEYVLKTNVRITACSANNQVTGHLLVFIADLDLLLTRPGCVYRAFPTAEYAQETKMPSAWNVASDSTSIVHISVLLVLPIQIFV